MHILIDGRMISNTGIGRWLQNVVGHLVRIKSDHKITVLVNRDSEQVRSFHLQTAQLYFSAPIYSIREQIVLPLQLENEHPDVVHFPNFNVPLLQRTPLVLTLSDLIYYIYPQACPSWIGHQYARFMIRAAAKKASRIITLSEHSKRDLIRHLGCPPEKIAVVYPAIDSEVFRPQDSASVEVVKRKFGIQRPYLFYTGNHEPRKNLERLVHAFRRIPNRRNFQLVLGGRVGRRHQAFYASIADLVATDEVILSGEIPEPDLPLLYAGAELFVFPSEYEGFGLPPLEAMATGVPVACSGATSLPEVVGDAAALFDPGSAGEMAAAMNRVLSSKQLASELREKGFERIRRFSWASAAQQIMHIYEQAVAA
jgi:glycosyltransferase involved in cell wall biosynthesis